MCRREPYKWLEFGYIWPWPLTLTVKTDGSAQIYLSLKQLCVCMYYVVTNTEICARFSALEMSANDLKL